MKKYLIFDWGGTFLKYAEMNEFADILGKGKVETPKRTSDKQSFFQSIDAIVSQYNDIQGIAISSTGVIDSVHGVVQTIGAMPYLDGCQICKEMEERYHVPISIENDGKCAALAELWKGNLSDVQDGAVVVIGTNVGAALILDRKLRRGSRFLAGEVCAMCVNISQKKDSYSYVGQLGTPYLCKLVQEKLQLEDKIDGQQAFAWIEKETKAKEALQEYTDALAMALFNINIVLDLEKILIGGGISEQPLLMESLKESIQNLASIHPDIVKGIAYPLPNIDVCKFNNDANLIGALYHFLYE